jgi:hypothetical protein
MLEVNRPGRASLRVHVGKTVSRHLQSRGIDVQFIHSEMNRETNAWTRIVVCVEHSVVRVIGQTGSNENGKTLLINRVKGLSDLREVQSGTVGDMERFSSVVRGVGLLGFLELKGATYLGVITKVREEGRIGLEHRVFSIQEVAWTPISFGVNTAPNKQETRHLGLISNFLKSGDFYFSPTLNLDGGNSRFVWNRIHVHVLENFSSEWTLRVIHGGFRSLSFSSIGRLFQFILIGRRSRFFAGTRYRKRGLNWSGDCANEVETEQIFIQFGPPDITCSFKQVRGSVPLHWAQDFHNLLGKPEIAVKNTDLKLEATRLHFLNLLERYEAPIVPVSLLLSKEGSGEASLGAEYGEALSLLSIPGVEKLTRFDLKLSASSSLMDEESPSMYSEAAPLVSKLVSKTLWSDHKRSQKGVLRTNCVDCLDRTSIFQYMIGLEVLNRQLIELGLLDEKSCMRPTWASTGYINPLVREIENIFDSVSDQLAVQYAGTVAHKKYSSGVSTEGSGLISSGRELLISISRHYSSSFTDNDKQNAMNLFLGMYRNACEQVDEDVCAIEGIDKFVHSAKLEQRRDYEGRREHRLTVGSSLSNFSTLSGIDWKPLFFHSPSG